MLTAEEEFRKYYEVKKKQLRFGPKDHKLNIMKLTWKFQKHMLDITGFHSIALLVSEIIQRNCGTLVYYTMKFANDYYWVISVAVVFVLLQLSQVILLMGGHQLE